MSDTSIEITPRIVAVVVTHNGEPWLEECLTALREQLVHTDVVVVDSGSRVPAASMVSRVMPDAEVVRLDRNVGFGAAANHGLEVSEKAREADYFLFIHDDVVLEREATSLLLANALETGAGIVGGKGLDWSDPRVLLEVGMSADQFGYPFSGLETGEIDQGQHDTRRETLYVTSACMLISKALIERVGLWDGGYFAFGEDLDLCTRARISGFKVQVQPGARFRHAVALVNGLRQTPATKNIRMLTRRNRPRTIAKNVAAYRMPLTLIVYTILAFAEMLFLAAFRRFEEIPAYPRALVSFIRSIPDVARRRRAVQKRRELPDRRLRRFMVRDIHRARVFFERRVHDWEVGTLQVGARTFANLAPSALKARFGAWVRRPLTLATAVIVIAFVIAARHTLTGGPVASGGIWPFPGSTSRLLKDYLLGWRDVRLGTESAAPTALPLLWVASVAAFGKAVLAQKLLIFLLATLGIFGMRRFVKLRTKSVGAPILAAAVYALGPVVELVFGTGDLGALALYAGLPYILEIVIRMLGPSPGPDGDRAPTLRVTDAMVRDLTRLALIVGAITALGPSTLIAITAVLLVMCLHSLTGTWDRADAWGRSRWVLASIPICLIALMPWSFEAMRPTGAILGPASSQGGTFAPMWTGLGTQNFLLLDPSRNWFVRAVTIAILIGAMLVPGPSRRREGRMLVVVWFVTASLGAAISLSYLPTLVASPAIVMVIGLACAAALAGHLIEGIREELPKHALGWRHFLAPATVIAITAGVLIGWAPRLSGWDRPDETRAANTLDAGVSESLSSFLVSTSEQVGDFRVLWLGDRWIDPVRSGQRRLDVSPYILTDPGGLTMLDMHHQPPSSGERYLDETVQALVGLKLHLAGHLLAPASVRFVIADPEDEAVMTALRRQRDMSFQQELGDVVVFQNLQWLPPAVLAPINLVKPVTTRGASDRDLMLVDWVGGRAVQRRSATAFSGDLPRTRHSQLLLGQNFNGGWRARVGDRDLEHHRAFGWSNRFELPSNATGEVRINFTGRWIRIAWVMLQALVILLLAGMARKARVA